MKSIYLFSLALVLSLVGAVSVAAKDDEHAGHHPAGAAVAPVTKEKSTEPNADMARMDRQTKAMHQMHDKMMATKTPEERNALMAEHMSTMQDGMTMMNGMSSGMGRMSAKKGDMTMHHQTMEKRMEMMQAMMQMMVDRLPEASKKP